MGKNASTILELDLENGTGEAFHDCAININGGSPEILLRLIDGCSGDIFRLLPLVLAAATTAAAAAAAYFHLDKRRT